MPFKLNTKLKIILFNLLSLFNRKKRKESVISANEVVAPLEPMVEVRRESYTPAVGSLQNITMMLDQEAAELYGRSRFIK